MCFELKQTNILCITDLVISTPRKSFDRANIKCYIIDFPRLIFTILALN